MMKESDYVYTEDLTKLRIAHTLLREIIHKDFREEAAKMAGRLYSITQSALGSLDLDTSDSDNG